MEGICAWKDEETDHSKYPSLRHLQTAFEHADGFSYQQRRGGDCMGFPRDCRMMLPAPAAENRLGWCVCTFVSRCLLSMIRQSSCNAGRWLRSSSKHTKKRIVISHTIFSIDDKSRDRDGPPQRFTYKGNISQYSRTQRAAADTRLTKKISGHQKNRIYSGNLKARQSRPIATHILAKWSGSRCEREMGATLDSPSRADGNNVLPEDMTIGYETRASLKS